jgi:hypothetical protein
MTLRLPLRSLTLSVLLLAPNAAAQAPQAPKQSEEDKAKARKEVERKALALLDETLQGAQALKLAENRAALRAQAADLLWARDEKRARSLFREAVADIVAARANADAMSQRDWTLTNLRTQTLYAAASRDPQFALELMRESRTQPGEAAAKTYGELDGELTLEQALVSMAADSDPKAALRMAEESLSKGVTYGVVGILERLRAKDSEAATRFAGEVVAKLRGESPSTHPEVMHVAFALLRTALMPQPPEQSSTGPRPAQGREASKTATCAT